LNPAAILALLSDLYASSATVTEENQRLREALAEKAQSATPSVLDEDVAAPK